MRTFAASLALPLLLLAARASAAPPPTPPPAASAAPAAPPAGPTEMPKVDVTDPLLAPVGGATHMLAGWHDALQIISARSVDIAVAQQEVERAQGVARQALAAALPTINGTASVGLNIANPIIPGLPTVGSTESASLTATQPIFAPRAWYAIGTTRLAIRSSILGVDDKRRTILGQVASAIVAVFTAERVAEINRLGLRNALQHQNLAERKARLGDGTRLDVLRAQQDVATARTTLISGDEALVQSREALGISLGSSDSWGVPPTISLDELQQSLQSACAPGTVDQRPDIAAARNDLDVANRQINDAKLAFSPTALVTSTAGYSANSNQGTSGGSWTIQGVLNLPIWEGGARYGTMRIARAGAEEAKLKLDAARRGATLEVTQAMRAIGVAEQSRVVAAQNRDLSSEAARLAERAFIAGAGTSLDLVDASRLERAAELNLALQEFTLIKARLAALLSSANCTY